MNYKAIKTEYRGVLFDSKSEAIFARLLELSGIHLELAHPIKHDNHEWDFLVWVKDYNTFHSSENGIGSDGDPAGSVDTFVAPAAYEPVLIELKPSKPSTQYIEFLKSKSSWVQKERRLIVWGSPFDGRFEDWAGFSCRYLSLEIGKTRRFAKEEELPASMTLDGLQEGMVAEAMRYRFDLKNGGNR
jgi:hypothetical protein